MMKKGDNVKPICKLIGEDGNVFNIIGKVSRTLKQSGMEDKASQYQQLTLPQFTHERSE